MNDSKYLYRDFYDGIIHILIMGLPIIVGTMNELLSQENGIIPVSLTIAIAGQMYSVKEVWKDERFSNSIRIKIEMLVTLLLLSISLIYTAVVFTLFQVFDGVSSSEIVEIACVADPNNQSFWGTYTVPAALYILSVIPYFVESFCVLMTEFSNCTLKITDASEESGICADLTSSNIN